MNDLTKSLLALEQLENYQNFFRQKFRDFETFHPFKSLPIELRLQIWRFCFPPSREMPLFPALPSRMNPVTLHINQESRNETLVYYRLILRPGREDWKQIFCFRPNYDILYLDVKYDNYVRGHDLSWLRYSINILDDVQTLELRSWDGRLADFLKMVTRRRKVDHTLIHLFLYIARIPNLEQFPVILTKAGAPSNWTVSKTH